MKLILGDCLDVLKTMAPGSVGHVVTDPPYAQTNESYDGPIATRAEVWRECYRVCGPNAALVAFTGSPTYHRIATAIESAGWKVRQMWGWVYRDGLIISAWPREGFDRLAPAMDPIVFATKGKVLLTLKKEGQPWARGKGNNFEGYSTRASVRRGTNASEGHYPRSIASDGLDGFQYFAASRTDAVRFDALGHPNAKPLDLMRWIVAKLPNKGPILDPFAGSATTLIAARDEGFDGIGIEQNSDFIKIGRRRLRTSLKAHETTPKK